MHGCSCTLKTLKTKSEIQRTLQWFKGVHDYFQVMQYICMKRQTGRQTMVHNRKYVVYLWTMRLTDTNGQGFDGKQLTDADVLGVQW